jgi:hypothetical protein
VTRQGSARQLARNLSAISDGLILVIVGTIRKNRWGINLEAVNCPHCEQLMSQVRKPRSMSQSSGAAERANDAVVRWTSGDARSSLRDHYPHRALSSVIARWQTTPSHSPDAVIIQNTKIARAEVGACQRNGLARQTPLMPNPTPARESRTPARNILSSSGS